MWQTVFSSILAGIAFGSSLAQAADHPPILEVAADGQAQYSSVQAAVDAAPSGAIVRIGPGTFRGPVLINKSVTLEGAGADRTFLTADWRTLKEVIVDGQGVPPEKQTRYQELRPIAVEKEHGEGPVTGQLWQEFGPKPTLAVEKTSGVTIRGLSISMPGTVWKGGGQMFHMVLIQNAGAVLEKCAFVGSAVDGIDIQGQSNVTLRNCLVGGIRWSGIVVHSAMGFKTLVEDCDIRGCDYAGMKIKGAGDVTVSQCRISEIEYHGVRYDDASPTITGNVFRKIVRTGIYIDGRTSGAITDNLFVDCGVSGGENDTIENNTFVRKDGTSPAWSDYTAVRARRPGQQSIRRNIIAGFDHALVLYYFDNKPLPREAKLFEQNLCDTAKSPIVRWQSVESKNASGPRDQPELQDLPLPEGNWQSSVKFRDPEHGDYSLSPDMNLSKWELGSRKHAALASPWPEQPAERAMLDLIRQVEGRFAND